MRWTPGNRARNPPRHQNLTIPHAGRPKGEHQLFGKDRGCERNGNDSENRGCAIATKTKTLMSKQSFIKEAQAIGLSVLFLALGLFTVWFIKTALGIQGDAVFVSLCLVPILAYLIISGRLSEFRAGGLEAKFNKLEDQLDDVRFVLTVLLQRSERNHLYNLVKGEIGYEGRRSLVAELRKLRTLGLIESIPGRHIGDMEKGKFDLKNFVRLTERGKRYVELLPDYQQEG